MKKSIGFLAAIFFLFCFFYTGCNKKADRSIFEISVENQTDLTLQDVLLEIDLTDPESVLGNLSVDSILFQSDTLHPFQFLDYEADGKRDKLLVLTDLAPVELKKIKALHTDQIPEFSKRTQAELSIKTGGSWDERVYTGGTFMNVDYLRVPPEHTDHSFYIRYEGPGWESDKVGYRFYLDWRNATDIFGKQTSEMVLQDVGQDGFDSYHEPADWGMDILKVGESLGIGSPGIWLDGKANRVEVTDSITCEIVANGPVYSEILTMYYGWQAGNVKTNLRSSLSITAGSRLTRHDILLSDDLPNLCTGIVKDTNARFLTYLPEEGEWNYIATYGVQSLAEDKLGMAVLFRSGDLMELTEDIYNHVVVLKPGAKMLTYYFLATWEKEMNGIQSEEEFTKYLDNLIKRLNNPVEITIH